MSRTVLLPPTLPADVCQRALEARDPRFDGLFFVGITTTGIYCRPICPSRRADPDHRRFFRTAAAAEGAGFRPCLRCRPELAPGRALVDAVPRLASAAARRIEEGALNGRPVASLASELHVSERHLRRAMRRELGVSPLDLAQTHRLLLARRLLAETTLDIGRVAFASGFQSVRRFNESFRERYGMSPTALRQRSNGRAPRVRRAGPTDDGPSAQPLLLTLEYRAPLAWGPLTARLRRTAMPRVEVCDGSRYGRTVRIGDRSGVVFAEDVAGKGHVRVEISPSLVPALMPVLARLRRLFDLDAEPAVIDAHLAAGGLGSLVRRCPGLRIPGAFDGFEVALSALLRDGSPSHGRPGTVAGRIARALGEPLDTGLPALDRLVPRPERVADAGASGLTALGVPPRRARAIAAVARLVAGGELRLDPGAEVRETRRRLMDIPGVGERIATTIVIRALCSPDAFPLSDPALQRAAGAGDADDLRARAEKWRPWRAYAALHLAMRAAERAAAPDVSLPSE